MLLASTTDPVIAYSGWKNTVNGTASAPETVAFFKERKEPGSWAASGARNRDIDTAHIVWDFLRKRRLTPTVSH